VMAEGVVRGDEEPGLAAAGEHAACKAVAHRPGVVSPVHEIGRALGAGEQRGAGTGAKYSPNFVHWTYDTWAMGHGLARGVLASGSKTWFFVTADYAFGHDLEKQASDEITASGGKIVGGVRHPLGASDFSSFLLQ